MSDVALRYESRLDALVASVPDRLKDDPEWLAEFREKALQEHARVGIPTPKNEEWKYTPLRPLAAVSWHLSEGDKAPERSSLPKLIDGHVRVVMVNGRVIGPLPEVPGLTILPISAALRSHEALIRETLGAAGPVLTRTIDREIAPDVHTFGELNSASFEDGLFVLVQRNTIVQPVVEVVHLADGDGVVSTPRLLIVAEDAAQVRVVETYVSKGSTLCLPVTEVHLAEGANVDHVRVQDESIASLHIGLWQIRQDRASSYRSCNVCFGGSVARVDQGVWLGGQGTTTRMDGVVVANGSQHIDNHTRIDHAMPLGESFEVYKQIVDDKAHVVFNGKIFVHQDAQRTDAKQTNQGLLLSPGATIDSKPQLEIFADDVKCTHGATVGRIEDTSLFYMRSRGIPRAEAEAVLVYAFAAEVLETIAIESIRRPLEDRLYEKLGVPTMGA